jgi:hypothetical protein
MPDVMEIISDRFDGSMTEKKNLKSISKVMPERFWIFSDTKFERSYIGVWI